MLFLIPTRQTFTSIYFSYYLFIPTTNLQNLLLSLAFFKLPGGRKRGTSREIREIENANLTVLRKTQTFKNGLLASLPRKKFNGGRNTCARIESVNVIIFTCRHIMGVDVHWLVGRLVDINEIAIVHVSFFLRFSFDVNSVQLADCSIIITVLDFNGGVIKDHFIGRLVLGKESSGPHEVNHWKNMLQSQRTAIAQWHSLKSRAHCDENCGVTRHVNY
ncbi:Synaptotagmin-17 [Orchesella cincta]|uniref:Synaptotagmin-17 n=1 Tax=Orchesella cincta TaxID=48709 RepID=A0A1D2N928_ORCCI|nr:Synaptotagmin-17 [Orchesella cincta]